MAATSATGSGNISDAVIISYDATLADGQAALMAFSNPSRLQGKSVRIKTNISNILGLILKKKVIFRTLYLT